ncbi:protein REVEILLE 2-like [Gossypium australe]|uniref:Protein REVEILLE 2-like n=1 Tax=Gossypium australe TaxID=47621 RepID=A0A5B6W1U5_9ROSI|nr:protein REVEILLE 2-like [Gossypium australe]
MNDEEVKLIGMKKNQRPVNSYHQVFWSSKSALLFVVLDVEINERSFAIYPLLVTEDLKQR